MELAENFVTDAQGNRIGVLLSIKDYQKLLDALEELEAIQAYDNAVAFDDEEMSFEMAISEIEKGRS